MMKEEKNCNKEQDKENSIINLARKIAHAESSENISRDSVDVDDLDATEEDDGSVLDLASDIARAESGENILKTDK